MSGQSGEPSQPQERKLDDKLVEEFKEQLKKMQNQAQDEENARDAAKANGKRLPTIDGVAELIKMDTAGVPFGTSIKSPPPSRRHLALSLVGIGIVPRFHCDHTLPKGSEKLGISGIWKAGCDTCAPLWIQRIEVFVDLVLAEESSILDQEELVVAREILSAKQDRRELAFRTAQRKFLQRQERLKNERRQSSINFAQIIAEVKLLVKELDYRELCLGDARRHVLGADPQDVFEDIMQLIWAYHCLNNIIQIHHDAKLEYNTPSFWAYFREQWRADITDRRKRNFVFDFRERPFKTWSDMSAVVDY